MKEALEKALASHATASSDPAWEVEVVCQSCMVRRWVSWQTRHDTKCMFCPTGRDKMVWQGMKRWAAETQGNAFGLILP